ncbi:MAG TPA: GGDEF domain-containing protein, partial [Coriobacteriia bacterium]|nr:GGDEF domain-containing protein [Coriobacteriia bacterium]
VAGALLVSAVCIALVALLAQEAGHGADSLPGLMIGMAAFTVSGVVIGAQAERARRHTEVLEETSILDPLTGLSKREHFERRLTEETRRCERYGLTCAVLIAEVECFDEFREQFGHYKAGLLLEHLGDVLHVSIRDHDIIGRYGPASFAILLPFADAPRAETVGARLRDIVTETEFEGDVLEPVAHCAIRTAVASYPDDGCERDALLAVAESRLREAHR